MQGCPLKITNKIVKIWTLPPERRRKITMIYVKLTNYEDKEYPYIHKIRCKNGKLNIWTCKESDKKFLHYSTRTLLKYLALLERYGVAYELEDDNKGIKIVKM